jgi:hypothetical protein
VPGRLPARCPRPDLDRQQQATFVPAVCLGPLDYVATAVAFLAGRHLVNRRAVTAASSESKFALSCTGEEENTLNKVILLAGASSGFGRLAAKVIAGGGCIDVLIHDAGHILFGPAEAFTPEQLARMAGQNIAGCWLENTSFV